MKARILLLPIWLFILSVLVSSKVAFAVDQCNDQLPLNQCWTTKDVIDEHIDSHAQKAMLQMFANGGNQAADASAMLCAVKRGHLEGIHLPDQKVPALRSKAAGSGWWKIIPPGKQSECYKEPAGSSPLIVFSKQIKDNKNTVASALSSAWKDCGLVASVPRCYSATISTPGPSPKPECDVNENCVDKYGEGYVCNKTNKTCEFAYGIEVQPRPCKGKNECIDDWDCSSNRCLSIRGQACGVCAEPGGPHDQCYEQAKKKHKEMIEICGDEEKSKFLDCTKAIGECTATFVGNAKGITDCIEAIGCGLGKPYFERQDCEKGAWAWLEQQRKRCYSTNF